MKFLKRLACLFKGHMWVRIKNYSGHPDEIICGRCGKNGENPEPGNH